jgi:hypothetical protein
MVRHWQLLPVSMPQAIETDGAQKSHFLLFVRL